jgi:hypothetical protein
MANTSNRGKSAHAAKHFCTIDQAAAIGEQAVKIARAERLEATHELVKGFEGRIAGLESRIAALESARWSVRLRRAWEALVERIPVARSVSGRVLTEEAPTHG